MGAAQSLAEHSQVDASQPRVWGPHSSPFFRIFHLPKDKSPYSLRIIRILRTSTEQYLNAPYYAVVGLPILARNTIPLLFLGKGWHHTALSSSWGLRILCMNAERGNSQSTPRNLNLQSPPSRVTHLTPTYQFGCCTSCSRSNRHCPARGLTESFRSPTQSPFH